MTRKTPLVIESLASTFFCVIAEVVIGDHDMEEVYLAPFFDNALRVAKTCLPIDEHSVKLRIAEKIILADESFDDIQAVFDAYNYIVLGYDFSSLKEDEAPAELEAA